MNIFIYKRRKEEMKKGVYMASEESSEVKFNFHWNYKYFPSFSVILKLLSSPFISRCRQDDDDDDTLQK
jgi:hypothetical protein